MIDEIRYSLQNVANRKLRTFLSVLSIMIGVMAIFALLSFGLGLQNYMDVLAAEAGVDKIYVQARSTGVPGLDDSFFISDDDIDFLAKVNGVDEAAGMKIGVVETEFRGESKFAFSAAWDIEHTDLVLEASTVDVLSGRRIKKGDRFKVNLGYNYQIANKVFKNPVRLGDKIELNGEKFEVVGFFEEVGNPQDDSNVYVTLETFDLMYPNKEGKWGYVMIRSEKGEDPAALADKISEKLRKHKGQDEGKEDFFVQSFSDALETFGSVIDVINGVLVLIALISVVVASVNIANTMYTAVLERTGEIGVMKAIGAQNRDILFIFVFESGFLGMVGGIIGVFIGFLIAKAGGAAAAAAGYSFLQPSFPIALTLGCIAFSFVVGSLSGILPAFQASKLKPVEALRYE
jgi:putative ABC transport system permease protein